MGDEQLTTFQAAQLKWLKQQVDNLADERYRKDARPNIHRELFAAREELEGDARLVVGGGDCSVADGLGASARVHAAANVGAQARNVGKRAPNHRRRAGHRNHRRLPGSGQRGCPGGCRPRGQSVRFRSNRG